MTVNQMRERLRELRDLPPPRTADQEAELTTLVQDLHAAEAAALADSTRRTRQEREATEARVRSLQELAARRTGLTARLEATLSEARSERRAIDADLASVLAGSPGSAGA